MQVLIVDDNIHRQADLTMAFMRSGFLATPTGSQKVAESCIRRGMIDLIVMSDRVGGRLTHGLALLAELKNEMVATILMTERTDDDVDELFLLLPSLHCLAAPDTAPELMARLAVASVSGAVRSDGPIILPPSMQVEGSGRASAFASIRQPTPMQTYQEIGNVA